MKIYSQKIHHKQRGLSIVELMIALVLSLVVMLVTTSMYVSNKQTYRFLDSYSLLQENGRFAVYFLREHILQAGYPRQSSVNAFPILPVNDTGTNNSDSIAVQFRSAVDCLNAASPVVAGVPTATNTFTIGVNVATGNSQLLCNGAPLVDGVESMQVLYGVDTTADGVANSYVDSVGVQAGTASGAGADWDNVVSVRVAVLVQGQANVLDQAQAITYNLLNRPYTAANDQTPRRVFTTTIPLRNKNKSII
jgi:type IV pilus assembly protein PilW